MDAGDVAPPPSPVVRVNPDAAADYVGGPPAFVPPPPPPTSAPVYAPVEEEPGLPIAFIKPPRVEETPTFEVAPAAAPSEDPASYRETKPIEFLTARLREKLAE